MRSTGVAPVFDDLFGTMDRVGSMVGRLLERASPDDILFITRISVAADAVRALKRLDTRLLPPDQAALALVDAERVMHTIEAVEKDRASRGELKTAGLLSDRIMETIGYLGLLRSDTSMHVATAGVGFEPMGQLCRSSEALRLLNQLADDYGADADKERRGQRLLSAVAVTVLLGAVALAVIGILDARQQVAFQFRRFEAYALVSLFLLGTAGVVLRQASRYRLAEQEARRLQRQFQGLEPYLSSLPEGLRNLMRGTLMPSLFSRLPTEEPWRDPRWPDSAALLHSMELPAYSDPPRPRGARLVDRLLRRFRPTAPERDDD